MFYSPIFPVIFLKRNEAHMLTSPTTLSKHYLYKPLHVEDKFCKPMGNLRHISERQVPEIYFFPEA